MKRIFYLGVCCLLAICVSGCTKTDEVTTLKNNNDIKEEKKEYATYNFGDLLNLKVSNDITISGNVIENGEDFVVLLQTEPNDNPVVTWSNVENELSTLKNKWTNTKDVRLMSIDVLLNNLKLSDNDIGNGYSGYRDEVDNFLYSDESYWVTDSSDAKGKCYETAGCSWAVFRPYVEKVTVENRINLRPIIEISKEYIVE